MPRGQPTTRITVRLTDAQRRQLESEAQGRPLAEYARERLLGKDSGPEPVSEAPVASRPYRCPFTGCPLEFGSPAARCPVHGRKVVEP